MILTDLRSFYRFWMECLGVVLAGRALGLKSFN